MSILVDTGAAERLRRGDRDAETLVLRHHPPLLCPHVAGEYLFGQVHGHASAEAYQEAREFIDSFEMVSPETDTAAIYGHLRAQLTSKGIQLSDPDIWIAAHALENRLPLLTTDRDFQHIPELAVHYLPQP